MNSHKDLLDRMLDDPEDWAAVFYVAYEYHLRGDEDRSTAVRWQSDNRKRPFQARSQPHWYDGENYNHGGIDPASNLPSAVFRLLRHKPQSKFVDNTKAFSQHWLSYDNLAEAQTAFEDAFIAAVKAGWHGGQS
jgi:hypothetical protein